LGIIFTLAGRNYNKKILKLLEKEPYRAFKAKEIARRLGVNQQDYHVLRAELKELVNDGSVFKYPRNRFGKGHGLNEVIGILHVKTQGYGFVLCQTGEDVFISQRYLGLALHKDKVRVRLLAQTHGKNPEGKIVEVIERARQSIVGTYQRGRKSGFVVPDELKIQRDIKVNDQEAMDAQPGQKVVVRITNWQDEQVNPEGRIVEVLGYPETQGVDVLSVARSFDLSDTFPSLVLQEAEQISDEIPKAEIETRLDLRKLRIFTVDPQSAKDFDDAVSLELLDNGSFRLGVHIADVSY